MELNKELFNNKQVYRINKLSDLELVHPRESDRYPGFFYFPDNELVLISKDNIVRNSKTGNILKGFIDDTNSKRITIRNNETNKLHTYNLHRIVGRTFIGRPSRHLDKDFSQLEINHVDGNRLNNSILNLEWVTGAENIVHAHKSGLHLNDTQVDALNIKTGQIRTFHSAKACADYFNIHRATFHKHLNSKTCGQQIKDNHVFRYHSDLDWSVSEIDALTFSEFKNSGIKKDYSIEDTINNKKYIVTGLDSIKELTSVPKVTLWRNLKKFDEYTYNNFKIKPIDLIVCDNKYQVQ